MSHSNPPENPDVYQARLAGEPPRPRRNRRGLLMFLAILGLLSIPALYNWLPGEAARWRLAAAEERRLDGDLEGAIQSLDEAIAGYPESADLYLQRAAYYLEVEKYALVIEDAERAQNAGAPVDRVLALRSQALLHLNRHSEAIDDCKELVRLSKEDHVGSSYRALNLLAYARALGKTELEEGLENAEESIRLGGRDHAMLDTRGYLRYQLGDYEAAVADLDAAVEAAEAFHARVALIDDLPDARLHRRFVELGKQEMAILRYHRSLAQDKYGEPEKAKADRDRVRQLGFEPNADLF